MHWKFPACNRGSRSRKLCSLLLREGFLNFVVACDCLAVRECFFYCCRTASRRACSGSVLQVWLELNIRAELLLSTTARIKGMWRVWELISV